MKNDTWTAEDERVFQAMTERRQRVENLRYENLRPVAALIVHRLTSHVSEDVRRAARLHMEELTTAMVEILKDHAKTVRDALEPFDDGIRVVEAEEPDDPR